jgi:hypothetical protein
MNNRWPKSQMRLVENRTTPNTPSVELAGTTLRWPAVAGAESYVIYRNGDRWASTRELRTSVHENETLSEYQVSARDATGLESFLSEPVRVIAPGSVSVVQPPERLLERAYQGFQGKGYVQLTMDKNTSVDLVTSVGTAGVYSIDARYANGNGPINSGDKAALRTLVVDGHEAGVLVMPHRGTNIWNDWGYTNPQWVRLSRGPHTLTLRYTTLDKNMNRKENTALLDHLRLTRIR